MTNPRPAGISRRNPLVWRAVSSVLLAGALLLPAAFQLCRAVTVLPESAGADTLLHTTSAGHPGASLPGGLDEPHGNASLQLQLQSGTSLSAADEGEADARLFLFVLLGFAAVAAALAELLGRKQ